MAVGIADIARCLISQSHFWFMAAELIFAIKHELHHMIFLTYMVHINKINVNSMKQTDII